MKKTLTISVGLNLLFGACAGYFFGKRIYFSHFTKPPEIPTFYLSEQKNKEYTARFATYHLTSKDIVFVGNSLTEAFPVSEYFEHAKNRGISGNRLYHVLGRIGQITSAHPKKIFLEIGINDINAGMSMDSIRSQYSELVQLIRAQSPSTELYIESLLPTCREYDKVNGKVNELNNYLSQLCAQAGANYVDIHSILLDKGKLNDSCTYDGLHLNIKGYELWRDGISKLVNEPKQLAAR